VKREVRCLHVNALPEPFTWEKQAVALFGTLRSAAAQKDPRCDPNGLIDSVSSRSLRHARKPAEVTFSDQHVNEQYGETIRIAIGKEPGLLLLLTVLCPPTASLRVLFAIVTKPPPLSSCRHC
jgi:hypothetical protein